MACKRSPVRSRYSPPQKALYFVGSMVLFFFVKAEIGGGIALSSQLWGFLQAVELRPSLCGCKMIRLNVLEKDKRFG